MASRRSSHSTFDDTLNKRPLDVAYNDGNNAYFGCSPDDVLGLFDSESTSTTRRVRNRDDGQEETSFGDWLQSLVFTENQETHQGQKNQYQCFNGTATNIASSSNNKEEAVIPIPTPSSDIEPPQVAPTLEETADIVNEEMKHLSLEERDKAYQEVHGIQQQTIIETPDLVATSLVAMKNELANLSSLSRSKATKSKSTHAYDIVLQEAPEYAHDSQFLLMFLRADEFQPRLAAVRVIGWFDWKLELFGRRHLCKRRLLISELDEETQFLFASGRHQVLPTRDVRGRTVVISCQSLQDSCRRSIPSMCRWWFYFQMSLVQDDVQTQKYGVVLIIHSVNSSIHLNKEDYQLAWKGSRFQSSMPLKVVSYHYCFNAPIVRPMISLLQLGLSQTAFGRFRIHHGNEMERNLLYFLPCSFKSLCMMSYGLPIDSIPISSNTADGSTVTVKKTNHMQWVRRRKYQDTMYLQAKKNHGSHNGGKYKFVFDGVELPTRNDVLLGKGKPIQSHPGNKQLHEWISQLYNDYDSSTLKGEKSTVVALIVKQLKSNGVRFLKRINTKLYDDDGGWWWPVSDAEAHDKVSHAFRSYRERQRQQQQPRQKSGGGGGDHVESITGSVPGGTTRKIDPTTTTTPTASTTGTTLVVSIGNKKKSVLVSSVNENDSSSPTNPNSATLQHTNRNHNSLKQLRIQDAITTNMENGTATNLTASLPSETGMVGTTSALTQQQTVQIRESSPLVPATREEATNCFTEMEIEEKVASEANNHAIAAPMTVPTASTPLLEAPMPSIEAAEAPTPDQGSAQDEELLQFVTQHSDCFKCPPVDVFLWLNGQDITTLEELAEACSDDEYVSGYLIPHGHLKRFKRGPFVKAAATAAATATEARATI